MKKRTLKAIPIAAALMVAFSLVLTACGASSKSSSAPAMAEAKEAAYDSGYTMGAASYAEEPAAAEEMDYAAANTAAGVAQKAYNGEVKLIYRANVSAEATDIDKAIAELEALAASMDGYVEYSDIGNYGYGNDFGRYANYTIRIPSEKYEAFLAALNASGSCNIRSLSKSTEDIGAEYADTEARLKTLRIKQERLQELLARAENMEDIIAIENSLTDVEYQIEWNSSSLNRYDALVSYSTISVYLQQVARETATGSSSLGERIVNSFRNGIASFATGFENFMVAVAGAIIPILIVIAIIVVVIILIVKAVKRGKEGRAERKKIRAAKKEKAKQEKTDETETK